LFTAAGSTRQVGIWDSMTNNVFTGSVSNTVPDGIYYRADVVIPLTAGTYTVGFLNQLGDNAYLAVGTEVFNSNLTTIQTVNNVSGFTQPGIIIGANFSQFGNFDFYLGVPNFVSTQEVNSVNTTTLLYNFDYNYYTNQVYLLSHNLHIGDLMITDQFTNPNFPNEIFVFQITSIVDADNFIVKRYDHGAGIKFIYDSLIINFNSDQSPPNPDTAYYWLDQKVPPGPLPLGQSLSLIGITPSAENKVIMRVYQPNNELSVGDVITIANSGPINQVPEEAINQTFTIQKILNPNRYEVFLNPYTPLTAPSPLVQLNIISITYPDLFQMFFNFPDTLGNILSFSKVGQPNAITSYVQTVLNTSAYANDYTFNSLGLQYQQRLSKLRMTGFDYFFISSPELGLNYRNTRPVNQVFGKIRWFDDPGNVVFDSFSPAIIYYDIPISQLSSINFTMYHPDGRLVEFNNLNHSFTIEIIEVYNQPDNTDINVRINSELIVRKI